MKRVVNNPLVVWFDSRTGIGDIVKGMLYEHIPGGARWRYVWGSTLVFCFVVQMITGLCLWMAYSPSAHTAWESVYYIQESMAGGWLLRGVHHYTAQVMMVLLALHVMQVVIDGAYRAPREFNFWVGLILLQVVFGLGLTGYLLPWDQKGYWATKVATNIMALTPVVGDQIQAVAVGGSDYGHHTLTRFFALHAGLLPFLMIVFVGLHVYLFRRHSITYKDRKKPDSYFWPDQVLKDGVACLAVLAVVLGLTLLPQWDAEGAMHLGEGALLMAPAEPSQPYSAARPDWYFLFLFQFLKYFEDPDTLGEVWGAIYIPGMVMGVVALMPFVGRWKLGHRFNILFLFILVGGAIFLTGQALMEDARDKTYQAAVKEAHDVAERVKDLAQAPEGIPKEGMLALIAEDAYIQGPRLFAQHCSNCHRFDKHNGRYLQPTAEDKETVVPATGSDLNGFATVAWLQGFFDPKQINELHVFGGTAFKEGSMAEQVETYAEKNPEAITKVIKALAAEARFSKASGSFVSRDDPDAVAGRELMKKRSRDGGVNCVRCHQFEGAFSGRREPTVTLDGYGSREWIIGIISDPEHEKFYGDKNDRMPAFGTKGILSQKEMGFIADWLRGDWYRPGDLEWTAPTETASSDATQRGETSEEAVVSTETPPEATESEPTTAENVAERIVEKTEEAATEVTEAVEEVAKQPLPELPFSPAELDFVKHVQPILEAHCFKCHGGGKRRPRGDYQLGTKELAMESGDSGEDPIVTGDSAGSYLFQLVISDDEDERMPPEGKDNLPLSGEQKAILGTWIDAGARWPEGVELQKPE